MELKQRYRVIGLMSGTSLDGLDIASCTFNKTKTGWRYEITHATTLKYSSTWRQKLSQAHMLSGVDLHALHAEYGQWLGKSVAGFISKHQIKIDFIASHGHTIFHQPKNKFTFQLGDGHAIHAASGRPVVCDFRSLDVAWQGEGAPLVPIGDKLLFHEYDVCLNLGGIANLSVDAKKSRIAYDICFMNMGLNYLAEKGGKSFDANGAHAESGSVNVPMEKALEKIYRRLRGKRPSLGRELFEAEFQGLLDNENIPLNDRLRTVVQSAATEIASALQQVSKSPTVLCTGGGAFNTFFMSSLLDACGDGVSLVIPDKSVVNFKEALVFAFLGMLRTRNEVNCLKTVTGALRNSSSGVMIGF
jgi:anhydro-N-acetylmuramic acid kinase